MAPFNARAFLRRLGVERAERYFLRHGLAARDGSARSTERHHRAFLALASTAQTAHLQTWQRLASLSHDLARHALLLSAKFAWGVDSTRLLTARSLATPHLAFDLYLDSPEAFARAEALFASEPLSRMFTFVGRGRVSEVPSPSTARRVQFQAHLAPLFAAKASAGRVVVEESADDERLVLFVYFEAAPVLREEVDEADVVANEVRPTVTVALLYHPVQRTLSVHLPDGPRTLAVMIRNVFSEVYLGAPDFFEEGSQGQFDFAPLARNGWQAGPCEFPVRSATVTEVAFRTSVEDGGVVTVQSAGNLGRVLDALFSEPIGAHEVVAVRMRFKVVRDGVEHERVVILRLPDECHLVADGSESVLEAHLMKWGIWRSAASNEAQAEGSARGDVRVA